MKMPKGQQAMSGMADAAVASFLVEAIHKFILGDALSIPFFFEVGNMAGSLGGVAAAALVPINMGVNPVLAISTALAVGEFGILPGFIAGYIVALIAPIIEKKLPEGVNIIVGALSGVAAAVMGIVNNAPGTASPIPGLLAPFAFNPPVKVLIALAWAIVSGFIGGMIVSEIYRQRQKAAERKAAAKIAAE